MHKMLSVRSRIIFLKHLKDFSAITANNVHNKSNFNRLKPDKVTNAAGKVAPRLNAYTPVDNDSRQHKTVPAATFDLIKMKETFSGFESKKISCKDLLFLIQKVDALLNDVLIESQHGRLFAEQKWFHSLSEEIINNLDQMSDNEIANVLNFIRKLRMPFNCDVYVKLIDRVIGNFENLSFANKVHFWNLVCNTGINVNCDSKLKDNLSQRIFRGIELNEHVTSSINVGAALFFVFKNSKATLDVKIKIATNVAELKNWDNQFLFTYFIDIKRFLHNSDYKELREKVDNKFSKEILNNNKYMHHALPEYMKAVNVKVLPYDQDYIDDIINASLKHEMTLRQLNSVLKGLLELRHGHYGVVKYIINILKKDPNILSNYPYLASNIVKFVACSNRDQNEKYRWTEFRDILRSANLKPMLKFCRNNLERFTYLLVELTSLEVFVDEELIIFEYFINNPEEFQQFSVKHMRFVLNVNQAIKLFHPSFTKSILDQKIIDVGIKKLSIAKSKRFDSKTVDLAKISEGLSEAAYRERPVLFNCYNELGFRFAGIVAVDKYRKMFDFTRVLKTFDNIRIGTIRVPKSYQLVALVLVSEREYCKNNLDLKGAISLEIKIIEKLGYPCVVLYDGVLEQLSEAQKGAFVLKRIFEVVDRYNKDSNSASRLNE